MTLKGRRISVGILLSFNLLAIRPCFAKHLFCADLISLNLPLVAQSWDYTCGAACFDSMFRYWKGWSPGEATFAQALGTHLHGYTPPANIVRLASAHGLFSSLQVGASVADLWKYVSRGETVFVTWWNIDAGHLSLVKGLGSTHLTLMDPWEARQLNFNQLSIQEFMPVWARFGFQVIRVSGTPLLP